MVRLPTLVVPCNPCDNTASAALMKGWISSIFIGLGSRSGRSRNGPVFSQHILDDFVQHFRLHRLLHEMTRTPLQRRDDVFLIAHRGHHDDARFRMLLDDPFGSLNAFHLRHGDVHEHDVRMRAVELADGGQAVPGLSRHLPAKSLDHAGQILAGKHGVVHYQVADRLAVFAAFYGCKLLHTSLPLSTAIMPGSPAPDHAGHEYRLARIQFPARMARPFGPGKPADRPHKDCSVAPRTSNPTTRIAYPRSIAALGMPNTTQDSSLCASVMPPDFLTAPSPSAPSSPIPVIKTPIACSRNSSAALRNSTSALGRCPFTRGSSERTTTSPSGRRFTFMWRLPGQISTRPGCNRSPDCASFTRSGQTSSSRRANMSVNPSGMCCTTAIVPGKSPGSCDSKYSIACGPPVETPMAMILVGAPAAAFIFSGFGGTPGSIRGFNLQSAAAFTFAINSRAVSVMWAEASLGLVTKSNAPSPSAFMVTLAPSVLCELKTITGTGCLRMISFSVSMPFMPGISRSSVTTLGFSSSIFFRLNVPSIAVPTTSMDSSAASICGISFRIRAESSTTSTRTDFFMPGLPHRRRSRGASGPCGSAAGPSLTARFPAAASGQRVLQPRAG